MAFFALRKINFEVFADRINYWRSFSKFIWPSNDKMSSGITSFYVEKQKVHLF